MQILETLRSWWERRKPRPLNEMLAVEFDETTVSVKVLAKLEPGWNQSFQWADVERVCFKDEGITSSDVLFIQVKGRTQPIPVLVEAQGGSQFFGALTERRLFPEQVWRKAMGETGGGLHCWPPRQ